MPTHAELAGRLLMDAAQFFRTIGEQNEALKPQMDENATVFEQISALVISNPTGAVTDKTGQAPEATAGQLAGRLLRDAAQFFRTVGEQNDTLKPQMDENANVFDQVAVLIETNPTGEIKEGGGDPPPNVA